jgi:hypothetical protein
MPRENQSPNAGAAMADASLNRRQTIRVGAGVALAQVGIVGFDRQIDFEALRLLGLHDAAPAVLNGTPLLTGALFRSGRRDFAAEVSWDLPSLAPGATSPLDKTNTASRVWADTAYRSKANETFMEENGFVSCIHRKKPKGRPMPRRTAMANGIRSKVRALVEHVFAEQKSRMGLVVRTVGIARATTEMGMANIVYNIKRLIFLQKPATG